MRSQIVYPEAMAVSPSAPEPHLERGVRGSMGSLSMGSLEIGIYPM
jgi:hypothetical protein